MLFQSDKIIFKNLINTARADMQTKKKILGRNSSKENLASRISRHHTKASENAVTTKTKVSDIISSAKKKHNDVFKEIFENPEDTFKQKPEGYTDEKFKSFEKEGDNSTSPYNIESSLKFENSLDIKDADILPGLTADFREDILHRASDIYLSMQNYTLECVDDESGQNYVSNRDWTEEDDSDDFMDFDPYLFIKNLPELSSVVPCFRPSLLPKQTRSCPPISLVLDLDETLVHSTLEPCDDATFTFPVNFNLTEHMVYVKCRPHLEEFMMQVAELFEVIVFTASQSVYAEHLLNVLDPKRKIFRHRVYRESCVLVEGNYLKDLSVLGRDLAHVVIVDNSPQAFGFQVDNGIPIESWFDDQTDGELLSLLPFLQSLVGVDDVRPLIVKQFNLRERISSSPSLL